MTQGQKNFPTKAAIKRGCLAHDRHTHLALDQFTTRGDHIHSRSNMATANFYNQPQSDYVSKILTEKRKAKKPLMEKMRRARINDSLNELKSLILEALHKDASRYSKMEKADVLEMTVHYLRELKRREQKHQVVDPTEYRASYVQCATEFTRKMTSPVPEPKDQVEANFLAHLASRCQGNSPNTTVAAVPVFSTESLRYMAPLQPVMIPFPSPPPSPLHVSPVLPVSTSLTRDIEPVSPASISKTRDTRFISSQEPKLGTPVQGASLWRPW
ncbi:transcription factor HES-4-A-like [Oculina patagonica]